MREVTDEELLNIYQIVGRFMLMYARIEMSLTLFLNTLAADFTNDSKRSQHQGRTQKW